MSEIDKQLELMLQDIKKDPSLPNRLLVNLKNIDHQVKMKFIENYDQGYCGRFYIPTREVQQLIDLFPSLNVDKINAAVVSDWKAPSNARMHNDKYYTTLAFLNYFAAKEDYDEIGHITLNLMLYKIWNGRLFKLIRYCNPEIMAAAISKYFNNRSIVKKYPSPLEVIQQHFTPTLYQKYKPYLKKTAVETKRVFEQCYTRIHQIFGNSRKIDLDTGQTKYQTGLQPSYYEAYANRDKIIQAKASADDNTQTEQFITAEITNLVDTVTTKIVLNPTPDYDEKFVDIVVKNIKGLRREAVKVILHKIHKPKYYDQIREILQYIFKRIRGSEKNQICSDKIYELFKTKIISSKNNPDVNYLKSYVDEFLNEIFLNDFVPPKKGYLDLTDNQKFQYRTILLFGIAYNIQKTACQF